jgi:hypothetical protein
LLLFCCTMLLLFFFIQLLIVNVFVNFFQLLIVKTEITVAATLK